MTQDVLDPNAISAEIDRLLDLLLHCRAVFPTIGDDLLGSQEFSTAPYYSQRGYPAQIRLAEPISADFIEHNRQLGKWISENALVRLYGLLSYHGFYSRLDQSLDGWREMDLFRRMRNAFSKTPLNYRPENPENIRLRSAMIDHFALPECDVAGGEIPTPINNVIESGFQRCREYVASYAAAQHNAIQRAPADAQPSGEAPSGRR